MCRNGCKTPTPTDHVSAWGCFASDIDDDDNNDVGWQQKPQVLSSFAVRRPQHQTYIPSHNSQLANKKVQSTAANWSSDSKRSHMKFSRWNHAKNDQSTTRIRLFGMSRFAVFLLLLRYNLLCFNAVTLKVEAFSLLLPFRRFVHENNGRKNIPYVPSYSDGTTSSTLALRARRTQITRPSWSLLWAVASEKEEKSSKKQQDVPASSSPLFPTRTDGGARAHNRRTSGNDTKDSSKTKDDNTETDEDKIIMTLVRNETSRGDENRDPIMDDDDDAGEDEHDFLIWKVNASDAFGSMLMQMQSNFPLPLAIPENEEELDDLLLQQQKNNSRNGTEHENYSHRLKREFLLMDDEEEDDDDDEILNVPENTTDWKNTAMIIDDQDTPELQDVDKDSEGDNKNVKKKKRIRSLLGRRRPLTTQTIATTTPSTSDGGNGSDVSDIAAAAASAPLVAEYRPLTTMTVEMAKELDDAVVKINEADGSLLQEIDVPSIYQRESMTIAESQQDTDRNLFARGAVDYEYEEYDQYNTNDELRRVALAIASRTELVTSWCQIVAPQIGGIYPMLVSLRKGAQAKQRELAAMAAVSINPSTDVDTGGSSPLRNMSKTKVALDEASLACRVLRDLCALSDDLAVVVVDSLLRADQSFAISSQEKTRTTTDRGSDGGVGKIPKIWWKSLFQRKKKEDQNHPSRSDVHHQLSQGLLHDLGVLLQRDNTSGSLFSSLSQHHNQEQEKLKKGLFTKRNKQLPFSTIASSSLPSTSTSKQRQLYVLQLLLAMCVASDHAVQAIRNCPELKDAVVACSCYASVGGGISSTGSPSNASQLKLNRGFLGWISRPWKAWRRRKRRKLPPSASSDQSYSVQAAKVEDRQSELTGLKGEICKTANQVLAAIGYNKWVPKMPGQRGLRILSLDGGGSRGMSAVTALACLVEQAEGNPEVCEAFDFICGTSTGGIIAFLTGLRQETSAQAMERYNELVQQIFVKSAFSKSLMLFTTASYDESPFMGILSAILRDDSMLDSRSDPTVPYVFAVASKMSSTPTHVALFRNYNYGSGELADPFTIDPATAREELDLLLEMEHPHIRNGEYILKTSSVPNTPVNRGENIRGGSRHPGSFRVLQRYALRASTAAPTFFKPVMMGGEMYCDGGIVASNPTAVAIHEAKTLFPDVPLELVVSIGTGSFHEQKSAPRIGWDGIIGQIVNSATDAEQVHHILQDLLGDSGNEEEQIEPKPRKFLERIRRRLFSSSSPSFSSSSDLKTRYFRFNPLIGYPDEYPIDVTEPEKLEKLKQITRDYMNQPKQKAQLEAISNILVGRQQS